MVSGVGTVPGISWFETREDALLTMRDLILRRRQRVARMRAR
jgi:hypothetical protein